MSGEFQDLNLARYTLHVYLLNNAMLFENLDSHLLAGEVVRAQLHFAKRPLADGLPNLVVTDRPGLYLLLVFTCAARFRMVPVLDLLLRLLVGPLRALQAVTR